MENPEAPSIPVWRNVLLVAFLVLAVATWATGALTVHGAWKLSQSQAPGDILGYARIYLLLTVGATGAGLVAMLPCAVLMRRWSTASRGLLVGTVLAFLGPPCLLLAALVVG